MHNTFNLFFTFSITLLLFLAGCNTDIPDASEIDKQVREEYQSQSMGIGFSDIYIHPDHDRMAIDIINYNDETKRINATTVCLDRDGVVISLNDSEILIMPPKTMIGWLPECPEASSSFNISVVILDME
jgi:hypothetical protein